MTTGLQRRLRVPFDVAIADVTAALKSEGFGVLTDVDVQQTLKSKIDVDFRRFRILGACNPGLAHEALQIDLSAGLMMPCSVTVYEADDGDVVVTAVDPAQLVADRPQLAGVATRVRDRLGRCLDRLAPR